MNNSVSSDRKRWRDYESRDVVMSKYDSKISDASRDTLCQGKIEFTDNNDHMDTLRMSKQREIMLEGSSFRKDSQRISASGRASRRHMYGYLAS